MSKSLVVSYSPLHPFYLTPLIKNLLCEGKDVAAVSMDCGSQRIFAKEKIPFKVAVDYIPPEKDQEIYNDTRLKLKAWSQAQLDGTPFCDSFILNGVRPWGLLEKNLFVETFENFYLIALFDKILETEKPGQIFIIDDLDKVGRTLLLVAKSKGIPLNRIAISSIDKFSIRIKDILIKILSLTKLKKKIELLLSMSFPKIIEKSIFLMGCLNCFVWFLKDKLKHIKLDKNQPSILYIQESRQEVLQFAFLPKLLRKEGYRVEIKGFFTLDRILRRKAIDKNHQWERDSIYKLSSLFNKENEDIFSYKGISLNADIFKYFRQYLRGILNYIKTAGYILDLWQPKLLISACDDIPLLSLIMLAKLRGIPTLRLPNLGSKVNLGGITRFHLPIPKCYDVYCVGTQKIKDGLIIDGVMPEVIRVVGIPRWAIMEKIFPLKIKKNKVNFLKKSRIDGKSDTFCLTTQQLFWEDFELAKVILNIMREYPQKLLILRPHPLEGSLVYKYLVKRSKIKNVVVSKKGTPKDIFPYVELLLTVSSTTAIQALLVGKPVISLNLTGQPNIRPYILSGAVESVFRIQDIKPTIDKLLASKDTSYEQELNLERRRFIGDYVGDERGPEAIDSILDLIRELSQR